ncbi:hypothetical protein [Streptomyces profundus]|uniref:hypothetical protein n=1 Tax=Streptomyces profundus TaxID=2867410 RepID=UPI001D165DD9|nr:hypothetical protein [Streptomyces sp. MA3_2.13]UED86270.1 hypothetical protein K4G22_20445 [Streptomyces sp. MA3_2.13]
MTFKRRQQPAFEAVRDVLGAAVEAQQRAASVSPPTVGPWIADELAKLAPLGRPSVVPSGGADASGEASRCRSPTRTG